jgi:hypothetical protein
VPDERYAGPEWELARLPAGRPPTRHEVWRWVKHLYRGVKTKQQAERFALHWYVGDYVWWVAIKGWDKPPDWVEGEVIPNRDCLPARSRFSHDRGSHLWRDEVSRLLVAFGRRPLPPRSALPEEDD